MALLSSSINTSLQHHCPAASSPASSPSLSKGWPSNISCGHGLLLRPFTHGAQGAQGAWASPARLPEPVGNPKISSWKRSCGGAVTMTAAPAKGKAAPTKPALPPPPPNRLHELYTKCGQSPWIDNLTRDWALSGHLEELVSRGVRGLTSNPTIFEKAIGGSDIYDEQMRDLVRDLGLAGSGPADVADVEKVYWEIAKTDIIHAAEIMRLLFDDSKGGDGFVSLEVSPALAHDTEGTVALARKLHETVGQPNLMVKIPATLEGIPAIKEMIAAGKSINVTLIFSLQRYADVIEAYISGLEARAGSDPGASLSSVASVASFFISRVDGAVDARLGGIGTPEAHALRGKAAVAQGVMAYQLFLEKFSGPRWQRLEEMGARVQRPLWASTGVKNKEYPDTLYVDELIGPATVNTMPDATIMAFADHGKASCTIDKDVEGSKKILEDIKSLGIDMEDVAKELEADGVKKFADSFTSLLETLKSKVTHYV